MLTGQHKQRGVTYVPGWQGLNPACFLQPRSTKELPFPFNAPNRTYFHRARYGIYHLFRALRFQKGETVLVPDYHQGSELWAIRAAGASLRYYHIDRNLRPSLDELAQLCESAPRALYVTHFLGWPQPIEELAALCRERGIILIEDCALSLLSESNQRPLGTFGDYAIFCLYKTLPVPNGGLLVQNRNVLKELTTLELEPYGMTPAATRTAGLVLEWLRGRSNGLAKVLASPKEVAGQLLRRCRSNHLPAGDIGFDLGKPNIGISELSAALLQRLDYHDIRQRRRENFRFLQQRLAGKIALVHTELGEDPCPLVFPLLAPDKPSAVRALRGLGISALDWWNDGPPEAKTDATPDIRFLRDHVLGLPIHQDITFRQVEYMAERVSKLNLNF
jgi:dTDP-4-amino-4,6-dideoxygalactose transaminase